MNLRVHSLKTLNKRDTEKGMESLPKSPNNVFLITHKQLNFFGQVFGCLS